MSWTTAVWFDGCTFQELISCLSGSNGPRLAINRQTKNSGTPPANFPRPGLVPLLAPVTSFGRNRVRCLHGAVSKAGQRRRRGPALETALCQRVLSGAKYNCPDKWAGVSIYVVPLAPHTDRPLRWLPPACQPAPSGRRGSTLTLKFPRSITPRCLYRIRWWWYTNCVQLTHNQALSLRDFWQIHAMCICIL